MSEDRLEQALQEMKAEDVDAATIDAARARVLAKLPNVGSATCVEFRRDFPAYIANELADNRRLLVEDHLSRCPSCRAHIAEMKGERTVIAINPRTGRYRSPMPDRAGRYGVFPTRRAERATA